MTANPPTVVEASRTIAADAAVIFELIAVRHNHVVEFEEGRCIAWRPSEPGGEPPGHLWRWTLQPVGDGTLVTHSR